MAVLGEAFTQWAAAMRTTAIQRVKLPAEVEQRQLELSHSNAQAAGGRNLVCFGNDNEFAHGNPSNHWDAGAVPPPTGGFFFHGISGNLAGTLTF